MPGVISRGASGCPKSGRIKIPNLVEGIGTDRASAACYERVALDIELLTSGFHAHNPLHHRLKTLRVQRVPTIAPQVRDKVPTHSGHHLIGVA